MKKEKYATAIEDGKENLNYRNAIKCCKNCNNFMDGPWIGWNCPILHTVVSSLCVCDEFEDKGR